MGVVRDITVVFLSVLNLGLGFPLCFYNGMSELWKAGLSLLFLFYLLTIVVVLIILSHFLLKLSNRIAELFTTHNTLVNHTFDATILQVNKNISLKMK